eukprot:7380606-Prymnesium_polylepis.5
MALDYCHSFVPGGSIRHAGSSCNRDTLLTRAEVVLADNAEVAVLRLLPPLAQTICDRAFEIGAEGRLASAGQADKYDDEGLTCYHLERTRDVFRRCGSRMIARRLAIMHPSQLLHQPSLEFDATREAATLSLWPEHR